MKEQLNASLTHQHKSKHILAAEMAMLMDLIVLLVADQVDTDMQLIQTDR